MSVTRPTKQPMNVGQIVDKLVKLDRALDAYIMLGDVIIPVEDISVMIALQPFALIHADGTRLDRRVQ